MAYPFTLLFPLGISLAIQALLWASYFFFIPFMDRVAVLWTAAGGAAAAAIFLFVYRFFATDMESWNKGLVISTLLQFASLAGSLWFVKLALFA